jgi:hypothetical protein
VRDAENARITDADYLNCLKIERTSVMACDVWKQLLVRMEDFSGPQREAAEMILQHGTLARRMKQSVQENQDAGLIGLYRKLAECLAQGKMLLP